MMLLRSFLGCPSGVSKNLGLFQRAYSLPISTEEKQEQDRLREIELNDQRKAHELPWRIGASVLVQRVPKLIPEYTDLQRKMSEMLYTIEIEGSLKNDHEVLQDEDLKRLEMKKKGELLNDMAPLKTALDLEDEWKAQLKEFTPASRTTEADENKNLKLTNRCLDRSLWLIVNRKIGNTFYWDLPVAYHQREETSLRQTAERSLSHYFGNSLNTLILGNAPFGFYKEKYSRRVRGELRYRGQKVFLFKGQFVSGEGGIEDKETLNDFQWVLHEEMKELLHQNVYKAVNNIIYDELP